MTCIVHNVKTKKELKEIVKDYGPEAVDITDPSIFAPFSGNLGDYLREHGRCCLTNHPKRSWFAEVKETDGKVKVS